MGNFESIEEKIREMENEQIVKAKANPLSSIILLAGGIIVGILGIAVVNSENGKLLTITLGVVIAIVGLIYVLKNTGKNAGYYIYKPTGKKLKKYKIYLHANDAKKVISAINGNNYSGIAGIKKVMDSGFLMDIRGTDDGEIFLLQLSEYVPHDFVPSSPIAILRGEEAKLILKFVKS